MNPETILQQYQQRIDTALDTIIPAASTRPAAVHEAMRYSLLAGGKRLRPVLTLAGFDLFPGQLDPIPAAIAVECIHTYSLIHDDLPCMDDSDLRRGEPTCHKRFGEAMALLAGDALLTQAFLIIGAHYQEKAGELVAELAQAAGSQCLIGGQVEDMESEQSKPSEEQLSFIHQNKTAALITVSLQLGMLVGEAPDQAIQHATAGAKAMGLAFQMIDDVLDATSTAQQLGKDAGADKRNKKLTYVSLLGLDAAREQASTLTKQAQEQFKAINANTEFLQWLLTKMLNRID